MQGFEFNCLAQTRELHGNGDDGNTAVSGSQDVEFVYATSLHTTFVRCVMFTLTERRTFESVRLISNEIHTITKFSLKFLCLLSVRSYVSAFTKFPYTLRPNKRT